MKKKYTHIFIPLFFSFLFFTILSYNATYAQNTQPDLSISFLKKTQRQTVDKVASNVLRIANNTSSNKELILKYNIPDGWKMVGANKKTIQLGKKDSVFIPVRTIPNRNAKGNTSFQIRASISDKNVTVGSDAYTVDIKKISNWTVELLDRKIYFTESKDSLRFDIQVENQGNSSESFNLILEPDYSLSLYGKNKNPGDQLSKQIKLASEQDTVMTFTVYQNKSGRKTQDRKYKRNDFSKKSSIRIRVKEEGASGRSKIRAWNGGVHVYSMHSQYDVGEEVHGYIPITIDWNTFNLLQDNTYSYLSVYGHSLLKNQQSIAFNYQSNFSNNYLNPETYLGDYHYLGYNSKYFGVELGNIGSPRNSYRLNGRGAKAHANYKGHRINGIYVRSPEIFGNSKITGYGGGYSYNDPGNRFKINSFVQEHKDDLRKIDSRLGILESDIRFGRSHYVRMEFGGSQEFHKFDPANITKLEGYSYKIGYRGNLGRVRYNLKAYVGSDNYIKYRGIENYSGQVRYNFDKGYSLGASYNKLNYEPELYSNGQIIEQDIFTYRDIYRLRFSKSFPNSSLVLSPRYQETKSAMITSHKSGLNLDYRYRRNQDFIISSKGFMGYVDMPQYNIDEFFTARALLNARFRYLSANVRYYYGPYLSREKIDFAETGDNPQKFYANIYYDFWFGRDKFLLKTNLNYNYTTINERSYFSTRPELFFYTDSKFRFSVYGRYIIVDEYRKAYNSASSTVYDPQDIHESNYEFGFGIRKDIFAPAGFGKKNELEVIAFKDVNGNGKQDPDEPGLNNMMIRLKEANADSVLQEDQFADKNYKTITNSDGRAVFTNLPSGNYQVKATALESVGGWFNGKTMIINVHNNRKLLLPLNKGVSIKGKLTAERADYSMFNNKIKLSSIRVTAFQEEGTSHSTLTDDNGEFTLYIPSGEFIVSVNEAALGDRLKLVENNKRVNLTHNDEKLYFYVVEKEREMNIKQFDSNGNEKSEEEQRDSTQIDTIPADTIFTGQADTLTDSTGKDSNISEDNDRSTEAVPDTVKELETDTISADSVSAETGYIPVQEFDAEGKIFTVQLIEPQETKMKFDDFRVPEGTITEDSLFCIPNSEGKYIFVAGKFEKPGKAAKLQENMSENYPQAKVIEVVEGNMLKEN